MKILVTIYRMRIDLQEKDGDLEALYKDVGDTAVAEAALGLILGGVMGSAVAVLLGGISILGCKGFQLMKKRKEKLKNEPACSGPVRRWVILFSKP